MSTCQNCGSECGINEDWTEEQRDSEAESRFGKIEEEEKVVVCNECYEQIMSQFN